MEEQIFTYLEELRKDTKRKQEQIRAMRKNPLLFLSDIVWSNPQLIPSLLLEKEEKDLLAYQTWLYQALLPALVEKYNIVSYVLHYEETVFPSPIYFLKGEDIVASLLPYEHLFVTEASPALSQSMQQVLEETERSLLLEAKLEQKEREVENPLLAAGDHPLAILKVSVQKKKTLATIKEDAVQYAKELGSCQWALTERVAALEKENERLFMEEELTQIGRRLREDFDFTLVDERMRLWEEFQREKETIHEKAAQEREGFPIILSIEP